MSDPTGRRKTRYPRELFADEICEMGGEKEGKQREVGSKVGGGVGGNFLGQLVY